MAQWIQFSRDGQRMPVMRREFSLVEDIVKAKIDICGLGQFALFVQDTEVNKGVLEPGWTDYRKRCLYSTYDITSYLMKGTNCLTVLLGNGMYHVAGERYMKFSDSYGEPVMWAKLTLEYASGRQEVIETDADWQAAYGPIVHSCIYGGEDFDGRCQFWLEPMATNPSLWHSVEISDGPGGALYPAMQPPVRIITEIPGVVLHRTEKGVLYDFGRNYAGVVRVRVHGTAGGAVKIHSGEILKDGMITQRFSGGPYYNTYILHGDGDEEWMPRFSMYSQRYAFIETQAEILEVTGIERYTDNTWIGSFECSNELYNAIHGLILGAIRGNMQSVFTDCPHREKLGWLEQLHLVGDAVLYNYDALSLLEKQLNDMEDVQLENGLVPDIAPEYVVFKDGFRDSPEWGSTCVILLWILYKRYGDTSVLERHYETANRYVRYLYGRSDQGYLEYGLGDWMDADHENCKSWRTPLGVTASMILYYDLQLMEKIAAILKRKEDTEWYHSMQQSVHEKLRAAFYDPETGKYAGGSQASQSLALFTGLVHEDETDLVVRMLQEDLNSNHGHMTGGDVGHPFTIRAMMQYGMNDQISIAMNRKEHPSYGYQVACGATTLCEDWSGPTPGQEHHSQNHFMLGSADEWFYGQLAGIQIRADENLVRFAPYFDPTVDWVHCYTGEYRIEWKRNKEGIRIEMDAPESVTVEIVLNDSSEKVANGGHFVRNIS